MEAKHFIVERGVLKVTDKPRPVLFLPDLVVPHGKKMYKAALESWKQEAYKVAGVNDSGECFDWYAEFTRSNKDGIYDCPDRLVFEVWNKNKEQVAILSFASPKEETPASKEKPDFEAKVWSYLDQKFGVIQDSEDGSEYVEASVDELTYIFKDYNSQINAFESQVSSMKEEIVQKKEQIAALQKANDQLLNNSNASVASYYHSENIILREQIAGLQEEIRQLKNKQ